MDGYCSSPETVCLQCGDRGCTNAFVYCVKCLKFAVHRYCLDVIPKSTTEYVRWVCDDCDVEVQNQPAIHKNDDIHCETRGCTASEDILGNTIVGMKKDDIVAIKIEEPLCESGPLQSDDACSKLELGESAESVDPDGFRVTIDEPVILSANERRRCERSSSQWLEEEKIKDNQNCHDKLSTDPLLKESVKIKRSATTLSTVSKDEHGLGNCDSSKRPHEKYANIGISESTKFVSDSILSTIVKEPTASEKRNHQLFSQQLCESDFGPGAVPSRTTSESSNKKKTNMSSEANLEEQRHRTPLAQRLEEYRRPDLKTEGSEGWGINVNNDCNKKKESEVSEDRTSASHHKSNLGEGFSKNSTVSSVVDCNNYAEPLMEPIWRGSFNIRNKKGDILGMMAHMSNRAGQKVYDEACQFQPVIHLEMLPKSDVWPKSFEFSEPSGENIALFLFPSDMRNERVFDHLVDEMLNKELALRAIVQNAELLVFTSMELPLPYWRFQGKYYLWGIFRGKHNSGLRSQSSQWESSCQVMTL